MTVAGTFVQYLAIKSILPIMVIKDFRQRDYYKDKAYRYGVCFDASPKAKKALECVLTMKQDHDRVLIITVGEVNMNVDSTHRQADEIAKKHGKIVEKIKLEQTVGVSVYKTIQKHLMDQAAVGDDGIMHDYIDFVCVGNTGLNFNPQTHEPNYLGSTAAMVLRAKKMNCLFIPS